MMKVAFFNTKSYDKKFFEEANKDFNHTINFFEVHLTKDTSKLAEGHDSVCVFVNEVLNQDMLQDLSKKKIKFIVLRCAGFNNVDIKAAEKLGIQVARVPAYSPYGVAEHAMALILTLNRKIHRSYNRVRDGNFSIEGLLGFEIFGKTVGIIGTGKIGIVMTGILNGFGCKVIAYDPYPNKTCEEMGVEYLELDHLLERADIITLHAPLTHATRHIINKKAVERMKKGVMIVNTSRGGLIDTLAVIDGLKSEKIGYVGLDVYEEEGDFFFEDLSENVIKDDVLARLLTFPNVVVTGHQAFFTQTALNVIARTTLANVSAFEKGDMPKENIVTSEQVKKGS